MKAAKSLLLQGVYSQKLKKKLFLTHIFKKIGIYKTFLSPIILNIFSEILRKKHL